MAKKNQWAAKWQGLMDNPINGGVTVLVTVVHPSTGPDYQREILAPLAPDEMRDLHKWLTIRLVADDPEYVAKLHKMLGVYLAR